VELIVALAVLGIIVVPLLHAFVTSTRTAARSLHAGNATLAAHNTAETMEATHLSVLTGSTNDLLAQRFGAQSSAFYTPDGSGYTALSAVPASTRTYCLGLSGVRAGGDSFDVMLTLDASRYALTNETLVTKYTPMDAVFSQPEGENENPDVIAANDFANQATTLNGRNYTAGDFLGRIPRVITVQLTKNVERSELVATAEYAYSYLLPHDTVAEDGSVQTELRTLQKTLTYEFYRGGYTDTDPGLKAMYFFFYPTYLRSGTGYDDTIIIRNPDDLPFSFFLVKERSEHCEDYEPSYSALLELRESINARSVNASVYSNLGKSLADGHALTGISYRIYRGETWYKNGVLSGDLVAASRADRMYGMKVAVYPAGDGFTGGTPLYTLDASKLD